MSFSPGRHAADADRLGCEPGRRIIGAKPQPIFRRAVSILYGSVTP
jgi:hypothetical protein